MGRRIPFSHSVSGVFFLSSAGGAVTDFGYGKRGASDTHGAEAVRRSGRVGASGGQLQLQTTTCMQLIMMVMDRGSFGSIGILGYACSGGVAGVFQSA
jgi:hypothetical protein